MCLVVLEILLYCRDKLTLPLFNIIFFSGGGVMTWLLLFLTVNENLREHLMHCLRPADEVYCSK